MSPGGRAGPSRPGCWCRSARRRRDSSRRSRCPRSANRSSGQAARRRRRGGLPAAHSARSAARSLSASHTPSLRMPISADHCTLRSRAASRCGLRVSGNGTSIAWVLEAAGGLEGDVGEAAQFAAGAVAASEERDARALRADPPTGRRGPEPGRNVRVGNTWMTAGANSCTARLPVLQPPSRRARPESAPRDQLPRASRRAGNSVHAGCSNWCSREVSRFVHPVGGLLGGAGREPLKHQHAVGQLALVVDLALVGEEVVAQVSPASAKVSRSTSIGRYAAMTAGTSASQACSIRFADHGAPPTLRRTLDVLDRVGYPVGVDVGEFPQRFVEQVTGALCEAGPPVRQSGQATVRDQRSASPASTGLVGSSVICPSAGHERAQRVQVGTGTVQIPAALEQLEEVVVEVEQPTRTSR